MLSALAYAISTYFGALLPLCFGDKQPTNVAATMQNSIVLIESDFAAIKSKNIPQSYSKRLYFARLSNIFLEIFANIVKTFYICLKKTINIF